MDQKALPAYGYSLYEFQVLGRNGLTERPVDYGENLAEGKTTTASSLRDVWWMYDENGVIDQTNVLAKKCCGRQEQYLLDFRGSRQPVAYCGSGQKLYDWKGHHRLVL